MLVYQRVGTFLGVKTTKIRKPNHLWIINTIYSQPSKSGLPPSGNLHNYMMLFSFGGSISNLTPQKLPRQDTQTSSCHKGTIWLPIEHGF